MIVAVGAQGRAGRGPTRQLTSGGGPERDERTIVYSAPEMLIVVLVGTIHTALSL